MSFLAGALRLVAFPAARRVDGFAAGFFAAGFFAAARFVGCFRVPAFFAPEVLAAAFLAAVLVAVDFLAAVVFAAAFLAAGRFAGCLRATALVAVAFLDLVVPDRRVAVFFDCFFAGFFAAGAMQLLEVRRGAARLVEVAVVPDRRER